jgi:glycosyltransferase involved in cell wall biosynthesis
VRVLLLDLAGDASASRAWLAEHTRCAEITELAKSELKSGSRAAVLRRLRAQGPWELLVVFCQDARLQPARAQMMAFGLMARCRRVTVADGLGRTITRGLAGLLGLEAPATLLQLLAGYGLVVPAAWCAILAGRLLAMHKRPIEARGGPLDVAYLRAAPGTTSQVGGSSSHVAGTVCAVAAMGHRVRLLVNQSVPGIEGSGAEVETVTASSWFAVSRAIFEVWNGLVFAAQALRRLRAWSPDLIYQRYNRFNFAGALASLVLRRPLYLEFNGSEVWVARHWDPVGQPGLLGAIERLNLRVANRIVVVSAELGRMLEGLGVDRERILVNANGVDPMRFKPGCDGSRIRAEHALDGSFVVGFVGTFGPWHGVEQLARAAIAMPLDAPVKFVFIGDGDLRAPVEAEIAAAGAGDRVLFAGRVPHDEVPAWLDACDCLVSPTLELPGGTPFFGSPTKLFEYLAMGKPVIASRLGQLAEVIVDDECGLLVTPGSVGELTTAIERLANDSDLCKRLGEAGRRRVLDHYTWRRHAERLFGVR